jgi:hypothetical protein
MGPNLLTLRLAPAVVPMTSASFGSDASGPGLPVGTEGLLLPIALAVVAVIAVIAASFLGILVRRRRQGPPASESAESDEATPMTGLPAGRDRNLPRWLDPSVAAARFRTDSTTAARAALVAPPAPKRLPDLFSQPLDELIERAAVRYDGVPLLDRPDDVLGQTQRELDGGDEVEVLERGDIWSRVRTPHGSLGWLPTMTIATVATPPVEEPPLAPPVMAELPARVDEPRLESILAAILAQRQPSPNLAASMHGTRVVSVGGAWVTPKVARTRKPKSPRPAATRRSNRKPAASADPAVVSEPVAAAEPMAVAEPVATAEPMAVAEPVAAADPEAELAPPKRRRSRAATTERGATRRR